MGPCYFVPQYHNPRHLITHIKGFRYKYIILTSTVLASSVQYDSPAG